MIQPNNGKKHWFVSTLTLISKDVFCQCAVLPSLLMPLISLILNKINRNTCWTDACIIRADVGM